MEERGRIGIPRALMFYRYFPFWSTFFEELGWKVVVSDGLGRKGKIVYFEDSCLPMKLLLTHAISLKEKVDHLFIPRLVSLHRTYIQCPKFRGAPDIVRLATEGTNSIIDETFDLRTGRDALLRSFIRIGEKLGARPKESKRAFSRAQEYFSGFQMRWMDRINGLPSRHLFNLEIPTPSSQEAPAMTRDGGRAKVEFPLTVALIGHPYNLFDTDINKDVLAITRSLGMRIVTADLLSEGEIDRRVSGLSKEIYWSSGREIVGSLLHFLSAGVDGAIFATSFKCGIDALLQEFIKRKLKVQDGVSSPLLVLSFDEHTGREGLLTRLEAFRDVMEEKKKISNDKPRISTTGRA